MLRFVANEEEDERNPKAHLEELDQSLGVVEAFQILGVVEEFLDLQNLVGEEVDFQEEVMECLHLAKTLRNLHLLVVQNLNQMRLLKGTPPDSKSNPNNLDSEQYLGSSK